MNFLADQDVYASTIAFVRGLGHDVITAAQLGLSQADDSALLRAAREQSRVFITRDRDFGGLVFVRGEGPGVIYLRVLPATLNAVHAELARVLVAYSAEELAESFVVVEPGRHRVRKVSP